MTIAPKWRSRLLTALIPLLYAGLVAGWWVQNRSVTKAEASAAEPEAERALAVSNEPAKTPDRGEQRPATPVITSEAVGELRRRQLRIPVDGANLAAMAGEFDQQRGGHRHEAVDILAPRETPVHAVEGGTIAKLFLSKAGGITVYQFDPSQQYCYYYAHLHRYAPGLHEGQMISSGDVIGFVGTTGNAPPNTPHLHFAIFELTEGPRWWKGDAIDPYLVFRR